MEGDVSAQGGQPQKKKWSLVVIIAVIVLLLAGAGYYVFAKKSEDGSGGVISQVVTKALNPTCKYNDPDLCKFINGWKEVKYLTMNSSDTANGKSTTSVFKMEGDDKSQIIMSENGKESYNVISIGNTTYTKDFTDNKWFKYTSTTSDDAIKTEKSDIDFDTKEESVEDKTTYQSMGTESCGSLTCFKYKVVDPANTDTTEYIYFDNKDYQLRKTRSESKDGVSEAVYDYGKFSISEPSPIKEGSPYDSLNTGGGAATVPTTLTEPSSPVTGDPSIPSEGSDYTGAYPSDGSIETEE